jgi:hypothetical protein
MITQASKVVSVVRGVMKCSHGTREYYVGKTHVLELGNSLVCNFDIMDADAEVRDLLQARYLLSGLQCIPP